MFCLYVIRQYIRRRVSLNIDVGTSGPARGAVVRWCGGAVVRRCGRLARPREQGARHVGLAHYLHLQLRCFTRVISEGVRSACDTNCIY